MRLDVPPLDCTLLDQYYRGRQAQTLSLTRALVEIESPSGDEAGSDAVVSLLTAAANTILAFSKIERISVDGYGQHLRLKAFESSHETTPPLVIIGHTDTVHPRGSLAARPWRIEGNRAF